MVHRGPNSSQYVSRVFTEHVTRQARFLAERKHIYKSHWVNITDRLNSLLLQAMGKSQFVRIKQRNKVFHYIISPTDIMI